MDDREVGPPRRRRIGKVVLAVGLGLGAASAPAAAQWAVVDIPHTVKTALGWVAQYQQMIETYERQVEQLQTLDKQFEQALVTGDAYAGTAGYREAFQERDAEEGIAEQCGLAPSRHPRGAEQHAYCQAIVRMENRRFNAVVAMLGDVAERDGELRDAYSERAGIRPEEEGKLASNTNRILSIQGQLQNDVEGGQRLMAAYDTALRGLRDNHVRLANEALGDSEGSVLAQGVALKLALRAARERDR